MDPDEPPVTSIAFRQTCQVMQCFLRFRLTTIRNNAQHDTRERCDSFMKTLLVYRRQTNANLSNKIISVLRFHIINWTLTQTVL